MTFCLICLNGHYVYKTYLRSYKVVIVKGIDHLHAIPNLFDFLSFMEHLIFMHLADIFISYFIQGRYFISSRIP